MTEESSIEQQEFESGARPPKGCKQFQPTSGVISKLPFFNKGKKAEQLPDSRENKELGERRRQIRDVFIGLISNLIEDPYRRYGAQVGATLDGLVRGTDLTARELLSRGLREYESKNLLIITDPRIKIKGLERNRVVVGGILDFSIERDLPNGMRRAAKGKVLGIALNISHRWADLKESRAVFGSSTTRKITFSQQEMTNAVWALIYTQRAKMSLEEKERPSDLLTREEFIEARDWVLRNNQ